MPKRTIYSTPNGQTFYKVNLPIYIDINMVQELMRVSGRNEKSIINELVAIYQQNGELGIGTLSDAELHVFVNKNNNDLELFPENALDIYENIIKDDVYFKLPSRLFSP